MHMDGSNGHEPRFGRMTPAETVRQASRSDLDTLVALMSDFYAESGFSLDPERAAVAFAGLLEDDRLGRIWIVAGDEGAAGYLVCTLGYSMEYGGHDAFIDDLYVKPGFRGRGLGTLALETARAFCLARGVRAIHLEVDRANAPAQRLYRKLGFRSNDRELLTLRLEQPAHRE